jgi:hypothetical protein
LTVLYHRYGETTTMVAAAIALAGILEPYWLGSQPGI